MLTGIERHDVFLDRELIRPLDHLPSLPVLGVDTENPTGAYGIYAELGFERQHTVVTLTKTVRPEPNG